MAFDSLAYNLVSEDTNANIDIFVHDRQTGQTTRVSVASDGTQGNGVSIWSSISSDGRYISFESKASNLVSGDTNARRDIFVHDQQTGQTTRISIATSGTQGNLDSYAPSISPEGRFVAFSSDSDSLVSGDTNGVHDVFVHDRQIGQTTQVSLATDGTLGNDASRSPTISASGLYIAYYSFADNLVFGDGNDLADIFLYDRSMP